MAPGGGPWFACGWVRPEERIGNGTLFAIGNLAFSQHGLFNLTTQGATGLLFEWVAVSTFVQLSVLPNEWTSTGAFALNQWQFVSCNVADTTNQMSLSDGVDGDLEGNTSIVPAAGDGFPVSTAFGSYNRSTAGHPYTGGQRNWVVGVGTPIISELNSFRSNPTLANAQSIWGAGNIWAFYNFDAANPQNGGVEVDLTGNGHDLTYINQGQQPWMVGPVNITPGEVWMMDGTGTFELFNPGTQTIRTTSSVTSLPAKYGTWTINLVANGYEFITQIFVNDGS